MHNNKKSIAILGCGWLGKALKKTLIADNYPVHCLTRDIIKNDKSGLYDVDVLIIAIPPKDEYIDVLEKTLLNIKAYTQVVLLSSISFYSGKAKIIEAEKKVRELHKATVILRLGGLMGHDRIAGKYTAGKVWDFDMVTNYIHRDDAISIIERVIMLEISSEVFDVVAPKQSSKKQIFEQNAKLFNFKENIFKESQVKGKVLTPKKLIISLGYVFSKEDVRTFWNTKK